MELTLLGTVAIVAFLFVGAVAMLLVSFRRTIELRGALIQAMRRIEKLEAAVAAGQPLDVQVTADHAETLALEGRTPLLPAPTIAQIIAETDPHDQLAPPPISITALVAALLTALALTAASFQALSGQAGVFLSVVIGLAVLGLAEWRRRAPEPAAPAASRFSLPGATLTALIGIALIFAALQYGRWVLGALHPQSTVFALAALAFAALGLSLRYGPHLIGASLICAALAPAMSLIQAPGAWGQYAFLFAFTALVMLAARPLTQPLWAWLASAVALFWGVNIALIGGAPFNIGIGGLYLAGLAALGLFYAWPSAIALPYPRFWSAPWREAMLTGHLLALVASIALAALLLRHPAPLSFTGVALILYALIAVGAAALRPGLWLAAPLAALTSAATLACWPAYGGALIDAPNLVLVAALLALIFSCGGGLAMTQSKDARASAALAAIGPVLIFAAAFWRIGGFGGAHLWAATALAIAALNLAAYAQMRRSRSNAAPAFAAGAALATAAAFTAITPPPYQPLAIAAALPMIALIDRWRDEAGLRFAAGALGAMLFAWLLAPQLFVATASPPLLLAGLFLPSAASAGLASLVFAGAAPDRRQDAAHAALALALVVTACCISLLARNGFTRGDIAAPYLNLAETGFHTLIWLGLALALAARFGAKPTLSLLALEAFVFAGAVLHAFVVSGALLNPWWGYRPAAVYGPPGLNTIELAYALPALALVGYAWLRKRQGLDTRALSALAAGVLLFLLTLVLELRRLYHGAAMASAPIAPAEGWTYSAATLGIAALLLAAGVERNLNLLRYASLALALLALGKMAFVDLGALDGLGRLAGFVLIAAAAGGLIFFYRRFVLPPGPPRAKTIADPNPELTP